MEDLAQTGRDGPHLWSLNSIREFDGGETLVDQLTRKINVDPVVKDDHDLRQSKLGNRTQLKQTGQAADCLLDRKRNLSFDFFGCQ